MSDWSEGLRRDDKDSSVVHADKGKKSRFRQLTDLVKSGVSAATSKVNSRANSRMPSRGVTQDLEGFEAISRQDTQSALMPVTSPQAHQAVSQKGNEPTALPAAQPRESAHNIALARPVAEGHAHSSQAKSTYPDALSDFAEILAAQPSRSASSAALLSRCPQAQQPLHIHTAQVIAIDQHLKDSARPVAEGTEAKQPVKPSPAINPKPLPKMGPGFMSGASTGRGAAVQAPVAEAAVAATTKARSNEQDSEPGLLPRTLPDDDVSMQR